MSQQFLPLLKPQNIDELKSLILQIMQDNDSKIQKIIETKQSEKVNQGQQFTLEGNFWNISDLNDILAQQCIQKQKIVSNLSHFSLSLMNTIEVLWQDNQDLQYKLKDQRQIVYKINNHLIQINKENQYLKNKLYSTYNDFQKVQEEKQELEEYIHSVLINREHSFEIKQNNKIYENPQDAKNLFTSSPTDRKNGSYSIEDKNCEQQSFNKNQIFQNQQQNLTYKAQEHEKVIDEDEIGNLLQQSVIKDSIEILKRFTLQQDCQNQLQQFQTTQSHIQFIDKSNRFSLMREISVQILQEEKSHQLSQQNLNQQKSIVKDLTFSNQKINVTIGTGTSISKTKISDDKIPETFSLIQQSPSCESFVMNRQNSAIMYPSFQKSNSSVSFVTHTTKLIQTDFGKQKEPLKKENLKKVQSKSIAINTRQVENAEEHQSYSKILAQKQEKQQEKKPIKENTQRKSFSQLLDYFTKKIVSDRIKANIKKTDLGGFKKTKSNIQKVF